MQVASKETVCVSCAISLRLWCMDLAITLRILVSLTSSYSSAGAAGVSSSTCLFAVSISQGSSLPPRPEPVRLSAASAAMSRSITLPLGPVGAAMAGSSLSLSAAFFALGDMPLALSAVCRAAAGAAASAGASSRCSGSASTLGATPLMSSPSAPITATVSRQGTSSPTPKNTASSFPDTFAASSNTALSVS